MRIGDEVKQLLWWRPDTDVELTLRFEQENGEEVAEVIQLPVQSGTD